MAVTKFFNAETCVRDMLDGIKDAFPSLIINSALGLTALNESHTSFVLSNAVCVSAHSGHLSDSSGLYGLWDGLLGHCNSPKLPQDRGNKVALVSGGGSGHEPFPAGYIASNMLTASVSGGVFASPPPANIYSAINFVYKYNKGGVLVIVLNYTGDNLNFGLATEHARVKGIPIETISINDDCALLMHKTFSHVGRRGILGCLFTIKILGAMSEDGASLKGLLSEHEEIHPRLASIGACSQPCVLPSSDKPMFRLFPGEISLGLGIHGEPGSATIPMCPFSVLVEKMIHELLLADLKKFGNQFCVMVANLGSSTQLSCFIFAKEVKRQLEEQGAVVERLYVGTVMSSLDMKGYQISVLNTTGKRKWLSYLDAETSAFGWPGTQLSASPADPQPELLPAPYYEDRPKYTGLKLNDKEARIFRACIILACVDLKKNIETLDELDADSGDGDCGTTMGRLADGLLELKDSLPWHDLSATLGEMSKVAETTMGGSSGAIYSLLLQGAARSATSWEAAWKGALETLHKHTSAKVGDRTMVDALAPACETFAEYISQKGKKRWEEALRLAVQEAKKGCNSTLYQKARFGRASYCEPGRLKDIDPGAYGVVVWLSAIAHGLL